MVFLDFLVPFFISTKNHFNKISKRVIKMVADWRFLMFSKFFSSRPGTDFELKSGVPFV